MRVNLLSIALLLVLLPRAAEAEVRVIDVASGVSSTLVADRGASVIRWTGDGTGLFVGMEQGEIVRVGLDGTVSPQPQLTGAFTVGPGGRTIAAATDEDAYILRAPDGHSVATIPDGREIAWSADGSRLALTTPEQLLVLDTATGAVLLRRHHCDRIGGQAFAADGESLVVTEGGRVLRLALASADASVIFRENHPSEASPVAALATSGRVAITRLGSIPVPGAPSVLITGDPGRPAAWSPDGQTLSVGFLDYGEDHCSPYDQQGLGVVVPGHPMRVLVAPAERDLGTALWSPDGTRLAIDVAPELPPAKRGTRHRWPKPVARA